MLGACTLTVHDTLILANIMPDSNFLHFRIVYILILPALSIVFAVQLVDSATLAENLSQTFEDRVRQSKTQLRDELHRQNAQEDDFARDEERQRIMWDMHDGLGGQLMSIIAMSNNRDTAPEVIQAHALAALVDLRTIINSLSVDQDITGLLRAFRERAEQQLGLAGIDLEWKMIEIPPIVGLTPSHALNIPRAMQEAVTNAVKHSGASKVTIRFLLSGPTDETLKISIEDNGVGSTPDSGTGRGLKIMKSRLISLNGHLDVLFSELGTTVTLSIPLAATGSTINSSGNGTLF